MERATTARRVFVRGTADLRRNRRSGWEMFLIAVVLCSLAAGTQAHSATEYQLKAAYLFNFARFIEWPPSSFSDASAPLRICVLGRDPFGEELRNITNQKTVNGRKLAVNEVVDLRQARSCQILFIASSGQIPLQQILEGLGGASVLTVGDSKGFAEQGGMINFVLQNDRVQFEVNRKAAERAGLKVSSKLLSVAKFVIG